MAILSTNSSLKDLFTKTQGNLTQPWILVDTSYVCYYSAASAWNFPAYFLFPWKNRIKTDPVFCVARDKQ